jgi:hypothetical protein
MNPLCQLFGKIAQETRKFFSFNSINSNSSSFIIPSLHQIFLRLPIQKQIRAYLKNIDNFASLFNPISVFHCLHKIMREKIVHIMFNPALSRYAFQKNRKLLSKASTSVLSFLDSPKNVL